MPFEKACSSDGAATVGGLPGLSGHPPADKQIQMDRSGVGAICVVSLMLGWGPEGL